MPFIYKNGDMFESSAEAVVNTVNCVGVMGKGVALEFKNRWPENYSAYKAACLKKEIRPGKMFVHDNGDMFGSSNFRYLINFPTKQHWRAKSKIEFIEDGLKDFASVLNFYDIKSVALPPLGCGNGGLDWNDVRPLIEESLFKESLTRSIFIYGPKPSVDVLEYEPLNLSMTPQRALLFRALGDLEASFGGGYSKISLQKIVYFLQALGVDFGLQFKKNIYGPYSSTLAKALVDIGNRNGFVNHETIDNNKETIRVSAVAYSKAADYLEVNDILQPEKTLNQLSNLISGFEGDFGLELLSSVHYLAKIENNLSLSQLEKSLHSWSERKQNLFDVNSISNAFERLKCDKLLDDTVN